MAIEFSIVARNATPTNYFIILLQIIIVTNFLLILIKAYQ